MLHSGGGAFIIGEAICMCGSPGHMENSVPPPQSCNEPKTALKVLVKNNKNQNVLCSH